MTFDPLTHYTLPMYLYFSFQLYLNPYLNLHHPFYLTLLLSLLLSLVCPPSRHTITTISYI